MNKRQQAYYRRLPSSSPNTANLPYAKQNYFGMCLLLGILFSLYTLVFIFSDNQQLAWAQHAETRQLQSVSIKNIKNNETLQVFNGLAHPSTITQKSPSHPMTKQVVNFIQGYFSALASNDIDSLMNYYADEIDYYDWGFVEKLMVRQEKIDFFERWPEIDQHLLGNLNISDHAQKTVVHYDLHFSVHNPKRKAKEPLRIDGEAKHTWHLVFDAKGQAKIVLEKQRVTKRQRAYK